MNAFLIFLTLYYGIGVVLLIFDCIIQSHYPYRMYRVGLQFSDFYRGRIYEMIEAHYRENPVCCVSFMGTCCRCLYCKGSLMECVYNKCLDNSNSNEDAICVCFFLLIYYLITFILFVLFFPISSVFGFISVIIPCPSKREFEEELRIETEKYDLPKANDDPQNEENDAKMKNAETIAVKEQEAYANPYQTTQIVQNTNTQGMSQQSILPQSYISSNTDGNNPYL